MLTAAEFRELKNYYRALSDVNRMRIVQILATEGDLAISALVRRLRISQPLVSWHIHRLRRSGIVRTLRIGREVRCSFDRERFGQLHERGFRTLMNRPVTSAAAGK